MSRCYWLPILAVIGFLAGSVQAETVSHGTSGQRSTNQSSEKPNDNALPTIPAAVQGDVHSIAGALEAANRKPESPNEKRNADAQVKVAWWTPMIFGIASFEALITAIGVALVGFTLHYTSRAATAAEGTLEETRTNARKELRAYIVVEPAGIFKLIGDENTLGHVIVRNVGKIPAQNVEVIVKMYTSLFRTERIFTVPPRSDTCDRVIPPTAEMRQGSSDEINIGSITNVANSVYVYGVVYYEDGYGAQAFTNFCHRYSGASYDRGAHWRGEPDINPVTSASKARYHPYGNNAT